MTTIVHQEPHTQAVITALRGVGLVVGEGREPDEPHAWAGGPATSQFISYVVVRPIPGGTRTGTLADPLADARMWYDVQCVASEQIAAERVLDLVQDALQPGAFLIPGRKIVQVDPVTASLDVRRDDDPEPESVSLFYGLYRFRLWTTPA